MQWNQSRFCAEQDRKPDKAISGGLIKFYQRSPRLKWRMSGDLLLCSALLCVHACYLQCCLGIVVPPGGLGSLSFTQWKRLLAAEIRVAGGTSSAGRVKDKCQGLWVRRGQHSPDIDPALQRRTLWPPSCISTIDWSITFIVRTRPATCLASETPVLILTVTPHKANRHKNKMYENIKHQTRLLLCYWSSFSSLRQGWICGSCSVSHWGSCVFSPDRAVSWLPGNWTRMLFTGCVMRPSGEAGAKWSVSCSVP